MHHNVRQGAGFLVVGLLSAAVDAGVFWVLFILGVWPVVASGIGFLSAFVINYRGNRDIVFRNKAGGNSLGRYIVLVIVNLGLSTGGVALAVALGVPPVPAKILTMVLIAMVNFVAMRLWVFPPAVDRPSSAGPTNPRD